MTSLWGRMLAVDSLQKVGPWTPWNQKFLGLERPTFWALIFQAVSRLKPKSWPGSLGDPVTFPKEGFLGKAKWCLSLFLPPSFSRHGDEQTKRSRGGSLEEHWLSPVPSLTDAKRGFCCHTLSSVQLRSWFFQFG